MPVLLVAYLAGVPFSAFVFGTALYRRLYKKGYYHIQAARYREELSREPYLPDGLDAYLCSPLCRFAEDVIATSVCWPPFMLLSFMLLMKQATTRLKHQ